MVSTMALCSHSPFRHFVSSVFLSRDITLPIQSFILNCWHSYPNNINRFVNAALQRGGIENLYIKLFGTISLKINLPDSIFSCKTLVVLHLKGVKLNVLSHLIVDLPRLKTLHLSRVYFQTVEYLPKFLSRCPILEELLLKNFLLFATKELVLKENFQYLPNLIRANISNNFRSGGRVHFVDVLFTLCCRAEVLHAELWDIKQWDTRCRKFPMYHNLTYLELILNHSSDCEELKWRWKWLLEVLKQCPKLQNLAIHESYCYGNESLDNWRDPAIVPECLSTQLRTCLLKGYRNTECEIQFAKYILQNSKVLNTMSIQSASDLELNVKYQMITKLTLSRRASTTCELIFD
ncbi:hypothetical protein QL285_036761 [Trifolium repens]|nr:hypothetical protein QL285_036761 [Trifolium repens]